MSKITKETVLNNQVWVLKGGLQSKECDELIDRADANGFKPSPATGGGNGQLARLQLARTSKVSIIEDHDFAQKLFVRFNEHLPKDLSFMKGSPSFNTMGSEDGSDWKLSGFVDRLRFYRYDKGDEYPEHQDGAYKRKVVTPSGDQYIQQSFMTVLFYLNDGFEGGETRFWDEEMKYCRFLKSTEKSCTDRGEWVDVVPKKGDVCLQLHMMYHMGCPVTSKDSKYIMRTDVLYEKKLKANPKVKLEPGVGEWDKLFEPSCKLYHD